MKTVAFFNNKGGVGKTSLVYHLAWMFAAQGVPVLAVDLDPQSNLTSMFLSEDRLERLWQEEDANTVSDCLRPLMDGTGDILAPHIERLDFNLGLLCGNLALSRFEDSLSETWPKCLDDAELGRIFRVTTAFYRMIVHAVETLPADLVLIDVGPNLGAINRATMIASDSVVLPLAPDLFSLQGLKNLGPTLRDWRKGWQKRRGNALGASINIPLPQGDMTPIGYVVMQHGIRDSRPVKAYQYWLDRVPATYREYVLNEPPGGDMPDLASDPHRLALLKHYRSLMPMAQEANKPIFSLTPADGAIGSHAAAVQHCYEDFLALARALARRIDLAMPTPEV